jgi:signal peptidase I
VGPSTPPSFDDGDWLLVDTNLPGAKRGELITMHYPKTVSRVYCRRVVIAAGYNEVMKYYSNVKSTTVYFSNDLTGAAFPQAVIPIGNACGEYVAR